MKPYNTQLAGNQAGDRFCHRMRVSREHAGLTRACAADKIGLTKGHLGRIECGAVQMVSDPMTLHRAAAAYGVSPVWLYGGAGAVPSRQVPDWYQPDVNAPVAVYARSVDADRP